MKLIYRGYTYEYTPAAVETPACNPQDVNGDQLGSKLGAAIATGTRLQWLKRLFVVSRCGKGDVNFQQRWERTRKGVRNYSLSELVSFIDREEYGDYTTLNKSNST